MSTIESEDLASASLRLDTNPIQLTIPAGSGIFGMTGEAWLTQEGVYEDVILKPGDRFDVRDGGPVVISATHATAIVYVARADHDTGAGATHAPASHARTLVDRAFRRLHAALAKLASGVAPTSIPTNR